MPRQSLLTALIVTLGMLNTSRADFVVTIQDAQIEPGSSGFVDVLIGSDAPLGDPLNFFNFEFRISTAGVTHLEFMSPQPDPQLTDPGYVFFGDSLAQNASLPVGNVFTVVTPNDTFIGGDTKDSPGDVLVTNNKLLARLEVTAATVLPPITGNTFSIQLVPSDNTFFADSDFNFIAFSSSPGTVTIGSTAIPEPGSFVLVALAGVLTAIARVGTRRGVDQAASRSTSVTHLVARWRSRFWLGRPA